MEDIFHAVGTMLFELFILFDEMLYAMDFWGVYIGYVFVAMTTGFLLRRFGSSLSLGSDKADYSKRKGDE